MSKVTLHFPEGHMVVFPGSIVHHGAWKWAVRAQEEWDRLIFNKNQGFLRAHINFFPQSCYLSFSSH